MDMDNLVKDEEKSEKRKEKSEKRKVFWGNVKQGTKNMMNYINPPKSPEQIEYERKLRKATEEARRKSYLTEAVRRSSEMGKVQAQKRYSPNKSVQSPFNALMGVNSNQSKMDNAFNQIMGFSSPKQQVHHPTHLKHRKQSTVYIMKPTKNGNILVPKKQKHQRLKQQMKQDNSYTNLLWNS